MRSMDINQENVCMLLVSADYISVLGLLELCCDFLKTTLNPENCIGIMLFARDYFFGLERDARCFVMRNFLQVSQQSDGTVGIAAKGAESSHTSGRTKCEEWGGCMGWRSVVDQP
jgi:kelch-like protein 10